MVEKVSFYAPGKLMITGEYVVLNGARSLAVPLQLGQQMDVFSVEEELNCIVWTSEDTDGEFFSGKFDVKDFHVIEANDPVSADYVSNVLQGAKKINPLFLQASTGCKVNCLLEFSRFYGFGSSSTLICNIAEWAGIDALALNDEVTRGSGYDVAVGQTKAPILFQRVNGIPEIFKVALNYTFTDKLWLVYLGHKQSSAGAILSYNPDEDAKKQAIKEVNTLTNDFLDRKTLKGFQNVIQKHEVCIAELLGKIRVKERLFPDFNGEIRSLGAWGGDFVMAATDDTPSMVHDYFAAKGFQTIFSFDELVLKNDVE